MYLYYGEGELGGELELENFVPFFFFKSKK